MKDNKVQQARLRRRRRWKKHKNRFINFEFNLTYRCNAACKYCNRLIDIFRIPNSDVTLKQAEIALSKLKATGIPIRQCKFSGGEPMLNKRLEKVIGMCLKSGFIRKVRVLSNGLKVGFRMPDRAKWTVDPILEGNDEYKDHQPFLISPDDYGIRSSSCGKKCSTAKVCGSAFDGFGFSFCGIAGALGHLLKINPYSSEPTRVLDERICKHCIYSLSQAEQEVLQDKCKNEFVRNGKVCGGGDVEYPSPTYRKAIEEYKKNPTRFPRAFEAGD